MRLHILLATNRTKIRGKCFTNCWVKMLKLSTICYNNGNTIEYGCLFAVYMVSHLYVLGILDWWVCDLLVK